MKSPFDLHVLSTPPAFILSQDQTLMFEYNDECQIWSKSSVVLARSGVLDSDLIRGVNEMKQPAGLWIVNSALELFELIGQENV